MTDAPIRRARRLAALAATIIAITLAAATADPAAAQLISLKTVPIAAGDQFRIFPSRNASLGGLSIALDDPALDPFVNPARSAQTANRRFFGAPVFYSIANDNGGGRTLPVGAVVARGAWFGGGVLAFQQLMDGGRNALSPIGTGLVDPRPLSERTNTNMYAFGLLGATLPGTRTAVAASGLRAELSAMDGVRLLYPRSRGVEQDGRMADYRIGLTHRSEDAGTFELLLLHNRLDMRHEVRYLDIDRLANPVDGPTNRIETNLDRGRTWGAHVRYVRPLGVSDGVRVGGILTANWKSHPKIPNYELMNIPRDPGHSWAYNFGVGLSRTDGPVVVGIDLVYEPIWSDTWAEAAERVQTVSGRVIEPGERTVDNDFRFSNAVVRVGGGRETDRWGVRIGMQVRRIHYWLEQYDHVEERRRDQEEQWLEWTPTWGASLTFPELEIRYTGGLALGTGRPGIAGGWTGNARLETGFANDYIVAPRGALTLQEAPVLTSQISIAVPIAPGDLVR